jgi:hypothetical protein
MDRSILAYFLHALGVPSLKRDANGNASLEVYSDNTVKLGKGKSVPITGSRALTAADDGLVLVNRTANDYVLTVPAGLPDGFSCSVIQSGVGTVTLTAGSSVTVANVSSYTKTGGAKAKVELVQEDTDTYVLTGAGAA